MNTKDLNPKVSIIIPCYNQGNLVSYSIESALKQTYNNIEIICINDGSTDNSSTILNNYANKYNNILFIDEKVNKGVCESRNKAINSASGEYILPLDADDLIEPSYVEKSVNIIKNNPKIGIVYCLADYFGTKNKKWNLKEFNRNKIIFGNVIFNCALFRKKDFEEIGGYKDYVKDGYEDWDLWLYFVEKGFEVYRINEILFHYRKNNKVKNRSDYACLKQNNIYTNIIKNHINLYLNNPECIERIFTDKNKYHKYKRKYIIFLIITIIQIIVISFGCYILWSIR